MKSKQAAPLSRESGALNVQGNMTSTRPELSCQNAAGIGHWRK
jgi:hypothetical protein